MAFSGLAATHVSRYARHVALERMARWSRRTIKLVDRPVADPTHPAATLVEQLVMEMRLALRVHLHARTNAFTQSAARSATSLARHAQSRRAHHRAHTQSALCGEYTSLCDAGTFQCLLTCDHSCAAPCDWVPCTKRCAEVLKCGHQCKLFFFWSSENVLTVSRPLRLRRTLSRREVLSDVRRG